MKAVAKKQASHEATLNTIAAHPIRMDCFFILAEGPASPKQLAAELGEGLNFVDYHVKKLLDVGAVEIVEERPVGNRKETLYRAIEIPIAWGHRGLSKPEREFVTAAIQRRVFADIGQAIRARTFDSREDRFLIRAPGVVDDEGFREFNGLLDDAFREMTEIFERSANRLASSGGEGIPVTAISMFFERPVRRR